MLVYTALTEYTTPLDGFTDGRNSMLAAAAALEFSQAEIDVVTAAFDDKGIFEGWDESGGSDSEVLIGNFAPLGSIFSPPKASGSRYVVSHHEDPLAMCCEPARIVVGNVNGSGGLTDVGQHDDPETVNDELPDLSGDVAVWSHVTADSAGIDFDISGRKIGGVLNKIASARGWQWFPAIDGNLVAWEDMRRGDTNIWARRIGKKPVKVTKNFGEEYEPDVSGNWIAWWDVPDFGERAAIGLMNFKTGKKVRIKRPGRAFVGAPSIAGKYVYWYEDSDFFTNRAGAGFGTIMRATRNGKEIKALFKETHRLAPVWNGYTSPPKVSANNNWVAYHEEFGYSTADLDPSFPAAQIGRDVFMVSAKGGPPLIVSCNKGDQAFPSIGYGQRVVFMDSSRLSTDLVTKKTPAGVC
jgi:beta propeller repeat protein